MSALKKYDHADLQAQYTIYIESGIILALLILIAAFRIPWQGDSSFVAIDRAQETVQIEEVEQTRQEELPPPPPRPQVPVEVPDEEVLEEATIELNAELDLEGEPARLPPPPPATEDGEEPEEEIFVAVEQMPELIGGIAALQREIEYPEIARKAGVEGTVVVQFVVDPEGRVRDPVVLRGIGAGCDQEALRVVRSARFEPGRQRGKAVPVRMALPIRFQLN